MRGMRGPSKRKLCFALLVRTPALYQREGVTTDQREGVTTDPFCVESMTERRHAFDSSEREKRVDSSSSSQYL